VKLVTFQSTGKPDLLPGLFTDRGVVSLADAVPAGATPTATMTGIIDDFDRLRPALERLARDGKALPAGEVRLRAPLPRTGQDPGVHRQLLGAWRARGPALNMFLKSADAVIGPGDTIVLPEFTEPWIFMHEAELALVIKGPAKSVKRDNWRNAVFGYTGMIDVSARW
jgi:2-keto-4-pentenoate hydratase/2-oxohepta-3-ene-1,7-dioic acid hydratase in catechol pathway